MPKATRARSFGWYSGTAQLLVPVWVLVAMLSAEKKCTGSAFAELVFHPGASALVGRCQFFDEILDVSGAQQSDDV